MAQWGHGNCSGFLKERPQEGPPGPQGAQGRRTSRGRTRVLPLRGPCPRGGAQGRARVLRLGTPRLPDFCSASLNTSGRRTFVALLKDIGTRGRGQGVTSFPPQA